MSSAETANLDLLPISLSKQLSFIPNLLWNPFSTLSSSSPETISTPLAPSQIPPFHKYQFSLLAFIISTCLYICHRIFWNRSNERVHYEHTHRSQVFVSLLHSMLSAYLSIGYVWQFPINLDLYASRIITHYENPIDFHLRFCLQMTLGYMIADLLHYFYNFIGLKKPTEKFHFGEISVSLLHHVIIIAAYATTLSNHVASFPEIALMTAEVSTPLLHLRYFMRESPFWRNSMLYTVIQLVFVLLFFVSRILYGSFVMFATYYGLLTVDSNVSVFMKAFLTTCCTLFVLVQYVWFWKIIRIFIAKVFGGKKDQLKED